MASQLTATITLERDGTPLPGFPVVRRLSADEVQSFNYDKADDGDDTTFTTIPTSILDTISALYITSDSAVKLRLDGQSDASINLSARGVVLILDATIDAGASTNATLNNNSGGVAGVTGLAAGT